MKILILAFLLRSLPLFADEAKCSYQGWEALYDNLHTIGAGASDEKLFVVTDKYQKAPVEICSDTGRFTRVVEERLSEWHNSPKKPTRGQIRLAYLYQTRMTGAAAEAADEFLGKAIENSTAVFLEEAQALGKESQWCSRGMVANLGDYGALPEDKRRATLERRRKALERVTNPKLASVKRQCLAQLAK